MKLYTVGYEGCDIEEFVEFLDSKKINLIADLRKNPVSRKRGFSKNRFAENLKKMDIDYIHIPALGMPREWRQKAKEGLITRKKMFAEYDKKILPKCELELRDLLTLTKKHKVAVLCYEADASDCHRSFAAEQMKKMAKGKLVISDLVPKPNRSLTGGFFSKPKTSYRSRNGTSRRI